MGRSAYRRGEVYTVDLDPVRGSEQGKRRPAVIIQNDIGNQYSPVVIVAAITSARKALHPVQVEVLPPDGGLRKKSLILLNQLRTVDKERLSKRWGRLKPETMAKVDAALKLSLGLVPL